jgi:hypothetical protein
VKLEKILKVCF